MTLAVVTENVSLKIAHHLVCALGIVGVLVDDVSPIARQVPHLNLIEYPCILKRVRRFDRHERAEKVIGQMVHV